MSIVELLVAIAVIAILLAIAVPAVMRARDSARLSQCQNNLRNLAMALSHSADVHSRYPTAGYHHRWIDAGNYRSWVVDILPWIDRQDIHRQWDLSRFNWEPPNADLAAHSISVLACPNDVSAIEGLPNLSYVVNGGFGWSGSHIAVAVRHKEGPTKLFDYNGNGLVGYQDREVPQVGTDLALYNRTSLFFLGIWPPGPDARVYFHSPASVTDGLTQTLMLAENVRAGYDPTRLSAIGWASNDAQRVCFFVSTYVCANETCRPGNVDYARANLRSLEPYKFEALNSSLTQPEGTHWPSSLHGPGVNFAFCDGRVKYISDSIHGAVYAAIASPQGGRIAGPLRQSVPGDGEF